KLLQGTYDLNMQRHTIPQPPRLLEHFCSARLMDRGEADRQVHRNMTGMPCVVRQMAPDRWQRRRDDKRDDHERHDCQPGMRPARRDLDELFAERDAMPPRVSDRQQYRMTHEQRCDDNADVPMQTVQSVASHGRLDPGETADEGQLKQYSRPDEQADQPAERHKAITRHAARYEGAGDVPPRD